MTDTPRADRFRARLPPRLNDWTLRQRQAHRRIWLEEIAGKPDENND